MPYAVLLCSLNVDDSAPLQDTVVSGQSTRSAPREGEAPAEPKEVVSGQWSVVSQNVDREFLPGRLLFTHSRDAAHVDPSRSHPAG